MLKLIALIALCLVASCQATLQWTINVKNSYGSSQTIAAVAGVGQLPTINFDTVAHAFWKTTLSSPGTAHSFTISEAWSVALVDTDFYGQRRVTGPYAADLGDSFTFKTEFGQNQSPIMESKVSGASSDGIVRVNIDSSSDYGPDVALAKGDRLMISMPQVAPGDMVELEVNDRVCFIVVSPNVVIKPTYKVQDVQQQWSCFDLDASQTTLYFEIAKAQNSAKIIRPVSSSSFGSPFNQEL